MQCALHGYINDVMRVLPPLLVNVPMQCTLHGYINDVMCVLPPLLVNVPIQSVHIACTLHAH